jgi:mono/diheme cytochrome c family protein
MSLRVLVWRATALAVAALIPLEIQATAKAVALQTSVAREVTFARDIAPIVFDACVSCHRSGGPGPFPLTTYDEVRRRATQIAEVTRTRFMPPWKVHHDVGPFVGQRLLTDREIAAIDQWAKNAAPEGDPRDLPVLPKHAAGWLLGKPDLVVKPEAAFTLPAQQTDAFRIFAIRIPVTKRSYVTGIEFHPGNARVVHHANIRIDRTAATRNLDAADPLPGYDGLMPRSAEYPDGHFLGWTPGQIAPLVQPELAWTLEPGSDLVVQLHMQPSGAAETVLPEIGFYFTDSPPQRTPTILRLGSQGIDIPPGEPRYVIRDSYTLPVDVQLLAIQPHAHYRAKEIRGVATFPDGTSKTVMQIADWDFRWQHVYRERSPIRLPKGTRLSMEYTYDNSASNPRNPELPPARVLWGQRSRDEMGDLWFQLLADTEEHRRLIADEILAKMTREDAIGIETMLKVSPDDHELHDDVAMLYLSMGEAARAVTHFAASAAQQPASAAAQFNLGTALTVAGRLDDAASAFERALAIRPAYAQARNNLGRVRLEQRRVDEALRHLREAVRLDPQNPQAWFNLAEASAANMDWSGALDALDRAARLPVTAALGAEIRAKREAYLRSKP